MYNTNKPLSVPYTEEFTDECNNFTVTSSHLK